MPELQLFSFLNSPRINTFSAVITNRQQNLVMALAISGPEAHFFGRDLEFKINTWQINSPEELHLQLLDLNKDCRLKKIQLHFALNLKLASQLVLACQGGQIMLERQKQIKKLLSSQNELGMLVGSYQTADQLLLLAGDNPYAKTDFLSQTKNWSANHIEKNLSEKWIKTSLGALTIVSYQKIIKKQLNLFSKIKKIWQKIKEIIKKIKNLSAQSKKRYLKLLMLTCCIIILSGLGFYWWKNSQKKQLTLLETQIQSLVVSEQELKQISAQQPILAREKVSQSQTDLENLLKQNNSLSAKKIIQTALEEVKNQLSALESENNLDRLTVYANWRDTYPDFLGQKLLSSPQGLVVGNDQQQAILLIQDQIQAELFPLDWQDFALDLSQTDNLKIFLKQTGLKELNWENKNISELKTEGDSDRAATLMTSYQDYIYLFNPEKRNIYRYTQTEDGLSEAIGWLIDKQGIDFSQVSDLSVDGDLWLTFKNGEVKKFSRGYSETFDWQGLSTPPSDSLLVTSKENIDIIVFLDKAAKRLLVSTKDGQLISEIKSNELAGASDIDLASDGQSCFALSGSVVYQIQL